MSPIRSTKLFLFDFCWWLWFVCFLIVFYTAFCFFCGYPEVAAQIQMCVSGQRAGIKDSGGRNES